MPSALGADDNPVTLQSHRASTTLRVMRLRLTARGDLCSNVSFAAAIPNPRSSSCDRTRLSECGPWCPTLMAALWHPSRRLSGNSVIRAARTGRHARRGTNICRSSFADACPGGHPKCSNRGHLKMLHSAFDPEPSVANDRSSAAIS